MHRLSAGVSASDTRLMAERAKKLLLSACITLSLCIGRQERHTNSLSIYSGDKAARPPGKCGKNGRRACRIGSDGLRVCCVERRIHHHPNAGCSQLHAANRSPTFALHLVCARTLYVHSLSLGTWRPESVCRARSNCARSLTSARAHAQRRSA